MKPQATSATIQDSPVRETACCYCGASNEPMRNKDLRSDSTGYAWRLAVACLDGRGCAERARARDRHLDQRWELTDAGRVAAMFIEQAEQLTLTQAVAV